MNKKYALFGVAAVVAIAGVIYFGTGANQQASVANIADKSKVVPQQTPTYPVVFGKTTVPKEILQKAQSTISALEKLSPTPSTDKKFKFKDFDNGWCIIYSGSTIYSVFEC